MRTSPEALFLYEFDDNYNSSGYVTHECYAEREFEFEQWFRQGMHIF